MQPGISVITCAMLRNRYGFTLIELSIVLVIISLIVGGVLVGRDLVQAAQIRNTVSQQESFNTAVSTFRLKYNCLPGDCVNASDFGVGTTSGYGIDGNGDQGIGDVDEAASFWYHLAQAGLVAFTPPSPTADTRQTCSATAQAAPCIKFNAVASQGIIKGGWWVIYGTDSLNTITTTSFAGVHYWWITGVIGRPGFGGGIQSAVMLPLEAYAIDNKLDDGLPLSGIAVAAGDANNDPYGPTDPIISSIGTPPDACVNSGSTPNRYNLGNSDRTENNLCSMLIRTSF
jgi:prepilin-type N-terminal cleavage/methylation domain-containing protein